MNDPSDLVVLAERLVDHLSKNVAVMERDAELRGQMIEVMAALTSAVKDLQSRVAALESARPGRRGKFAFTSVR